MIENFRINNASVTLVDQVEEKLLEYFQKNKLTVGSVIPRETDLAASLGVARSVLREALSRLKMLGIIESRTKRGIILHEPNLFGGLKRAINPNLFGERLVYDIIKFRVALEIGITDDIIKNITDEDIKELEDIITNSAISENNLYVLNSETRFHTKLYEITGSQTLTQFQEIIHPIMVFLKTKHNSLIEPYNIKVRENGQQVTHEDLLNLLKKRDAEGYREGIKKHLAIYSYLLDMSSKESNKGICKDK